MKQNNTLIILLTFIFCAPLFSEQAEHPLFKAAREGNANEIKKQIENNENCAITDEQGNNLFHIAAEHGQSSIIEELTVDLSWWQRWVSGPTMPSIYDTNKAGKIPVDIAIIRKKHAAIHYLLVAMKRNTITPDNQLKTLRMAIEQDDDMTLHLLDYHQYDLLLRDSHNNTLVHEAVTKRKIAAFHYLASHHAPLINAKNKNDEAPIVVAVNNNDIAMLQILGQHKADVNIAGKNGSRPLHSAKKPEVIDCLITLKALIDSQDKDGHTPLHYRIKDGNIPLIKHLLSHGADVTKRNNQGKAAFSIAIDYKRPLVTTLIAQQPGSDVNEKDDHGRTSFLRAAADQDMSRMKELIQYSVKIDIHDNFGENIFHKFAKNGYRDGAIHMLSFNTSLLKNSDVDGRTPIMMATQYGWTSIALVYSEKGALLNTQDNNKNTLLHEAAKTKNLVLIEHYLQKKAPILANKDHNFFYHYSAEKGDLEAIKLAKKYNVPLNHCAPGNNTILHLVIKNNQMHCVPELLYPAMINYKNDDGVAPLSLAAFHGDITIIETLIRNGADLYTSNKDQSTPMHYAAYNDKVDALVVLKKHGLTTLCRDKNGDTPQHIAAQRGSLATIDYYKENDPQTLSARNNNNETPFITGARFGQTEAAKKLLCEDYFINDDIEVATKQAQRNGHHDTERMLKNEDNKRIQLCKEIVKINNNRKNYIENVNQSRNIIKNKQSPHYIPQYRQSTTRELTWQQLYRMTTEQQNVIEQEYKDALYYEQNVYTELQGTINAIALNEVLLAAEQSKREAEESARQLERVRREAEKIRREQEVQERKRQEDQKEMDAQARRVAEHKAQQEKKQQEVAAKKAQEDANLKALAEAQKAAAQNVPNVPQDKAKDNANEAKQEVAKCLICWDEDNLVPLPCARCKIGSGRIHQECIADLNGKCPTCRGPLEK